VNPLRGNALNRIAIRQHNLGNWLGALKTQFSNTQFYIGLIQFGLVVVTAYHTTLDPWFVIHVPWMNIMVFILSMLGIYVLAMILDYMFILPSVIAFGNRQSYKHENPVKADFERVLKELKDIKAQLGEDINLM
jgi:hypothetical protein